MHAPADGLSTDAMLRSALDLAETAGVLIALAHEVLPGGGCSCGNVECGSPGKHPRGDEWQLRASSSAVEIAEAFARWPGSNVGIATGRASGIVVLDIDGDIGEQTLTLFPQLPAAPEVRTARGRHLYFTAPDIPLRNRAGARGRGLGPGLDLRAEGGFVVVPPSRHASGAVYRWTDGRVLGVLAAPPTPEWIVERARDQAPSNGAPKQELFAPVGATRGERWARAAFEREVDAVARAAQGGRNEQLNISAFNLSMLVNGQQLDGGEVKRTLLAAAIASGLSEFEATKTIRSGFEAGAKKDTRTGPTRELARYTPTAAESRAPEQSHVQARVARGLEPRISTAELFAALPAQRWCVPGLQIGPGRPTLIAGYGASAKTIAVQALVLALASGRAIWGHFESSPLTVLHVDYEQGLYATAKRYQRLALGLGIDPRELCGRIQYVQLPRVYLDKREGEAEYLRACEGVDLVVVDALRGASPHTDENDSAFRGGLDALTFCSQHTGASHLVLHHAAKPRKDASGDARTVARGSSAIFDACGCVLNFTAQPGSSARLVTQAKTPAEAEGAALDPFELLVEDVAIDGNLTAGARVLWRAYAPVDESVKASQAYDRDAAALLRILRNRSGTSTGAEVVARCGMRRARALDVLRALVDEGRLEVITGPKRTKVYRVLSDNEGKS